MQKRFFITATGTGIGKTFITAALVRQAKVRARSIAAFKPVISGFDSTGLETSDTCVLLNALGLAPTAHNIERISPWRFLAPLGPSMAAAQEGRTLDFEEIIGYSRTIIAGKEDIVLIEGAGGVMAPLDKKLTVLDWIAKLGIPALLITGTYLGTLSHTLTALAVLKQRKIPVAALIVNESPESPVSFGDTVKELTYWTDAPVISVNLCENGDDAPELGRLLD